MNQSELEANTCSPCQARETRAGKSRLVLVLLLISRESGARFFSQSQTVAMQNQSSCVIPFDSQLKSALLGRCLAELSTFRVLFFFFFHVISPNATK